MLKSRSTVASVFLAVAAAGFSGCEYNYHPENLGILVRTHSSAVFTPKYSIHSFTRQQLTDQFWSEGACFADVNKDGNMDVVAGPFWYEGPAFTARHEFMPATHVSKSKKNGQDVTFPGYKGFLGSENEYSANFFAFSYDFNQDGWPDILIIGFPGESTSWFENPGKDLGLGQPWKRHLALDVTDDESPQFVDINGDGKPDLICASKGSFGYAEIDTANPANPFRWHAISPDLHLHKFTHGIGIGDVNGDGKMDLLEKDGWWEQPAALTGDPVWQQHKWNFGTGGAQMFAYDVNGDGLNDVITSLAAHQYGLAWFEQYREGGEIKFKQHLIMNKEASENRYGVHFSQIHAIDLVDMDGDGLKDIVTGKRAWAHGPEGDPEPNGTPYVYWFQLQRASDGTVDFVPHLIDDASGVGTQVMAQDYNGDGLPDVVVGNKRGVFVFTHQAKSASREEWEAAQPKPLQ